MHKGRNYGKTGRNPRKGIKLYTEMGGTIKSINLRLAFSAMQTFMVASARLDQMWETTMITSQNLVYH